jgi:hypothetical protein
MGGSHRRLSWTTSRSAGRDPCSPTKPAVCGRSIEAPLAIELDEVQQCRTGPRHRRPRYRNEQQMRSRAGTVASLKGEAGAWCFRTGAPRRGPVPDESVVRLPRRIEGSSPASVSRSRDRRIAAQSRPPNRTLRPAPPARCCSSTQSGDCVVGRDRPTARVGRGEPVLSLKTARMPDVRCGGLSRS